MRSDDFDLSLCLTPQRRLRFWVFHCHSYLADDDSICGKAIFVESNGATAGWHDRQIRGRRYIDITKRLVNTSLIPLPDSRICQEFCNITGDRFDLHEQALFENLLMVPAATLLHRTNAHDALVGALRRSVPWKEALDSLSSSLEVPRERLGLTGSWALDIQRASSDVDLVLRVPPSRIPLMLDRLRTIQAQEGGPFPDKYNLRWPLRVRKDGVEWCLFVTYTDVQESPLRELRVSTRGGRVSRICGTVFDDTHSCYTPSVMRLRADDGSEYTIAFVSTEARGVFRAGDRVDTLAMPCTVGVSCRSSLTDTLYVVVDGLANCVSLKEKLIAVT